MARASAKKKTKTVKKATKKKAAKKATKKKAAKKVVKKKAAKKVVKKTATATELKIASLRKLINAQTTLLQSQTTLVLQISTDLKTLTEKVEALPKKKTPATRKKAAATTTIAHTNGNGGNASISDFDAPEAIATDTFLTPPAPATLVTKDQVTEALRCVSETHGIDKMGAILANFGARRIGEIKEADYKNFVAACDEVSMSAPVADGPENAAPASATMFD